MHSTKKQFATLLAMIVMIGAGCVQPTVSDEQSEKAAQSLSFSSGDQIVLRETFLGLGGKVVELFGGTAPERIVKIDSIDLDSSIDLDWSLTTKQETEASVNEQKIYDDTYANAPIGTLIPDPPTKEFETVERTGFIRATNVSEATHVFLPTFWMDTEQTTENKSLIWLTREQYQQLTQTRKTSINLGLFDDSIAFAQSLSDKAKDLVNWLTQNKQETEREDVLLIQANQDFGTYTLDINGKEQTVRTIQAQNAFAKYTILANENNPLILEVVLTPVSRGSFNIFNKQRLFEAFVGYEVVSITQNESSSVHPPPQ